MIKFYLFYWVKSIGLLSSAVEGFTFFRLPPRVAVWKVSNAPFYTAVDISTLGRESHETSQTRVYTLVYTRSCSSCRLHPFVARLDRIQLGSGH